MKKMIKLAGVVAVAFALTQTLQAIPITGGIGFQGAVTLNTSSAGTATAVTSWVSPSVLLTSGSFTTVPNFTSVAFAIGNWYFSSAGLPGSLTYPINNFWKVGGFSFQLQSSGIVTQGGGAVNVQGTGVVSGNSFDPTVLTWSFTTQDPSVGGTANGDPLYTFSASTVAPTVPDGGATVMLLGIALSGVAMLRRKLS
jgi:hypothetical protein